MYFRDTYFDYNASKNKVSPLENTSLASAHEKVFTYHDHVIIILIGALWVHNK